MRGGADLDGGTIAVLRIPYCVLRAAYEERLERVRSTQHAVRSRY
jgi:hypothetical protein